MRMKVEKDGKWVYVEMVSHDFSDMTKRQKTAMLKRLGARITYIFDSCYYPEDFQIEFDNGDSFEVTCASSVVKWDGKAWCRAEAKEMATEQRINELLTEDAYAK